LSKGFTLIELLIVIAVLGVLATIVLVAIDPLEQLSRGTDAGQKTKIASMGHALQSYYTTQNAVYPTENATWQTTLVSAGELKQAVSGDVAIACSGGTEQNDICYDYDGTDSAVWLTLKSKAEKGKCPAPATDTAYFVWTSVDSRAGTLCFASGQPVAGTSYAASFK